MATPGAIIVSRDHLRERDDLAEQFLKNNQRETGSRLAISAGGDRQVSQVSQVGHGRVTS
jgi:hypothetical protein